MRRQEVDELITPVLPWSALLASWAMAAAVALTRKGAPPGDTTLLGLMGLYLVCESLAPRLANFGRFPLSGGILIAVASMHALGPLGWFFLAAAGTLVRFLRARHNGEPLLSLAADGLPELWAGIIASLTAHLVSPLAAGPVAATTYLIAWQFAPGLYGQAVPLELMADWSLARERSLAMATFLCILGCCFSWIWPSLPWVCLVGAGACCLLSNSVASQLRVLQAEVNARQQALRESAQERTSQQLQEMRGQVELQRVEVELQHRVLTLVGELFMETALVQSPQDLRPALLTFVRRVVPCGRVGLYEADGQELRLTCSQGSDKLEPRAELLQALHLDQVKSSERSELQVSHLAASIPHRGLLVVSDQPPRWQVEHTHLLQRLAHHLPLCLDAVRYRELQSRALEDEQSRRKELDRLAARLTAALDLLSQLVSCRTLEELVQTAQFKLPSLVADFTVEVEWQGKIYSDPTRPTQAQALAKQAAYSFPLYGGRSQEGRLRLYTSSTRSLSVLDTELMRLISSQFACLLETAVLNEQLRRTLEQLKMSQAQLVQSSKMAAIGQLAAGVAHELNTPLGAISIAVELALETLKNSPEKAGKRLQKAMESVEQMQGIISKLLFYSRDSRGVRSEVELNKVMEDSLNLVAHTMKLQGVVVELREGPSAVVMANANELQQIVSNLLINAKDACRTEGARDKRIEMWLDTTPSLARIHVRDYGCGMDEATRQRIFEPFFTTKAIGEGTGLGLSTTLELVQQHEGKLDCESRVGEGTHFVVSLPLNGTA